MGWAEFSHFSFVCVFSFSLFFYCFSSFFFGLFAFLRFLQTTRAKDCNLLQTWGISLRPVCPAPFPDFPEFWGPIVPRTSKRISWKRSQAKNLGLASAKSPGQDFVHRVAQELVTSWSIPRQLPTPWEVARVFIGVVLWQHPIWENLSFRA